MALVVVRNDHGPLVNELEDVRRRGAFRVFRRLDKQGPLDPLILSRVVAGLCPELWEAKERDEALATVLQAAIQRLPKKRLPDSAADMNWQEAALLMYQITSIPAADIPRVEAQHKGKPEYVKRARYVQDTAILPEGDETLSELNSQMRNQLAAILLEEEVKVTKANEETPTSNTPEVPDSEFGTSTPEAAPQQAAEPMAGTGGMTVSVTKSKNVVVGSHASQTNHFHK